MKKLVLGIAGLAMMVAGSGCGLGPSNDAYWDYRMQKLFTQDTNSVQSSADRMHTLRQVADQDARAMVDDWDFVWMTDRPSRLSRWHNR
ncbi:MAG: hypothetical protein H6817_00100 [Phycisphaerales bacterium]|nr:hypothetical protein [Phycisphaerales bacterium]